MLITYGSFKGKPSFKGGPVFLGILCLVGLGLGIAVTSSGVLKKKIVSLLELKTKESPEAIKVCNQCKEDIISRLPDDILCSILSRLSTKDAVRTSILLRRWRILYVFLPQMSLPKISLNCLCMSKNMPLNHHCTCSLPYKQRFLTVMNQLL